MSQPAEHQRLVTAAPFEPVTLAELRAHSVVQFDDDDQYLVDLLRTATTQVENHTQVALVKQTREVAYGCFPDLIRLPRPPLLAVLSVKYYDTDGVQQTLPTADYQVSSYGLLGRIAPAPGTSWPATESGRLDAVVVRYTAGYVDLTATSPPTTPNPVGEAPYPLKQAIMVLAAHLYTHRELSTPVAVFTVPDSYHALLESYEIMAV